MPTLTCPNVEQLAAFQAGRLSRADLEQIASHLETCASCQTVLEKAGSVDDALVRELKHVQEQDAYTDESGCQRAVSRLKELANSSATNARDDTIDHGTQAPPALPLKTLGKYQLLEAIGQGGMGTVYKAVHTLLKRTVAVKVLSTSRLQDPQAVSRFRREIEAAGRLDHPHIVRTSDAGEAEGQHFLVMEWLAGQDLSKHVREHGPLPVALACDFVRQAALGLGYAHKHGMVHRDVKPSNLLLTTGEDGKPVVKVLDLGLALLHGNVGAESELTSAGQVMGTYDYIAPEQAMESHAVDARADMYSLGCTFHFLLAGEPPFPNRTPLQKLHAHQYESPTPLTRYRQDVPPEVLAVLTKMMAKAPAQRFGSMRELVDVLEGPATKRALDRASAASAAAARPAKQRRPLAVALLLLAGLLVAALGAFGVIRIATPEGDYVIDTDDPKMSFSVTKGTVTLHDKQTDRTYILKAARKANGQYELDVRDFGADLSFKTDALTIKRGETLAFKAWFERKPLAADDRTAAVSDLTAPKLPVGDTPPAKDAFPGKLVFYDIFDDPKACKLFQGTRDGVDQLVEHGAYRLDREKGKPGDDLAEFVGPPISDLAFALRLKVDNCRPIIAFRNTTAGRNDALVVQITLDGHWSLFRNSTDAILAQSKAADTELAAGKWVNIAGRASGRDYELWLNGKRVASGAIEGPATGANAVLAPAIQVIGRVSADGRARVEVDYAAVWDLSGYDAKPASVPFAPLATSPPHTDGVTHLAVSRDGTKALTYSADKFLWFWEWDADQGAFKPSWKKKQDSLGLQSIALEPSGTLALLSEGISLPLSSTPLLTRLDTQTEQKLLIRPGLDRCGVVAISPDGRRYLVGDPDGFAIFALPKSFDKNAGRFGPPGELLRKFTGSLSAGPGKYPVLQFCFSGDGERILSAGDDKTVRLWNSTNAEELKKLPRFASEKKLVIALAPDGKQALVSQDNDVQVWDLDTGKMRAECKGHKDPVTALAYGPDGGWAVSASRDKTLRVWEVATGKELAKLEGHTDDVTCVAVVADGRRIVSASRDKTLRVWSLDRKPSGEKPPQTKETTGSAPWPDLKAPMVLEILTKLGVKDRVKVSAAHSFSDANRMVDQYSQVTAPICLKLAVDLGNGVYLLIPLNVVKRVASQDKGHVVTLIDGSSCSGKILTTVVGEDGRRHELASVSQMSVAGAQDAKPPAPKQSVASLSVVKPQPMTFAVYPARLRTNTGAYGESFKITVDGESLQGNLSQFVRVAVAPGPGNVWDCTIKSPDAVEKTGVLHAPNGWWWLDAELPNGCLVVVSNLNQSAGFTIEKSKEAKGAVEEKKNDPVGKTGEIRSYLGHADEVRCVAFTPDGKSFLSGARLELWLWDVDNATERVRFPDMHGFAGSATFSQDGQRVIGLAVTDAVVVWEAKRGEKVREMTRFKTSDGVRCVIACPDRPHVFYANRNGGRIYDLDKKAELPLRFLGERASLSENGRRLLTVDGITLYLWDMDTAKELSNVVLPGRTDQVALAPDGRLAVACVGNNVHQWDMDEKKQGKRLDGPSSVFAVAISPDGKRALTGGGDKKVRLWDLQTGTELHCFDGHSGPVISVAFAPNGRQALSGSRDKTVRLWQLPPDDIKAKDDPPIKEKTPPPLDKDTVALEILTKLGVKIDVTIRDIRVSETARFLDEVLFSRLDTTQFRKTGLGETGLGRICLDQGDGLLVFIPMRQIKSMEAEDQQHVVTLTDGSIQKGKLLTTIRGKDDKTYQLADAKSARVLTQDPAKPKDAAPARTLLTVPGAAGQPFRLSAFYLQSGRLGFGQKIKMNIDGENLEPDLADFDKVVVTGADPDWRIRVITADGKETSGKLDTLGFGGIRPWWLIGETSDGWLCAVCNHHGNKGFTLEKIKGEPPPKGKAEIGEIRSYLGHPDEVTSVAFAPDGKSFLSCCKREPRLWDIDRPIERLRFKGGSGWTSVGAISHDGKLVVASGLGGNVLAWDAKSGKKVFEIAPFRVGITVQSVLAAPDGPIILHSSQGGVQLFDLDKKQEIPKRFPGERATLSKDGRRILSCAGQTLHLGDVETGKEIAAVILPSVVRGLALAPDGRHAVASTPAGVAVWDMEAKKHLRDFADSPNVLALAFSPDGTRVLSGGADHQVRLWDLATGKQLHAFEGHSGHVRCVAFSPDGTRALSGSDDKSVRLWQLP